MVEPFARAAFALEPWQMSNPVTTEFGHHLILVVDRKPGKEVQFESIKPVVREVYFDRLRDAVINAMRPRAQIVLEPTQK
jgi:peptidyl-prolyl cis-trans isomerase C